MDSRERAVVEAQERFERQTEKLRLARQDAFSKAQADGLSLAQIGKLVGLHRSRVDQIIHGK